MITCKNIQKAFGQLAVLKGIDFFENICYNIFSSTKNVKEKEYEYLD